MNPKLKLGEPVIVLAVTLKQQNWDGAHQKTEYVRKPIEKRVGIFIGYRTPHVGYTRYGEDGPEFKATGHITVALVVFNQRQNPVTVAPEDLM